MDFSRLGAVVKFIAKEILQNSQQDRKQHVSLSQGKQWSVHKAKYCAAVKARLEGACKQPQHWEAEAGRSKV